MSLMTNSFFVGKKKTAFSDGFAGYHHPKTYSKSEQLATPLEGNRHNSPQSDSETFHKLQSETFHKLVLKKEDKSKTGNNLNFIRLVPLHYD